MANKFFRNSIPSSVPKRYIAYGNKRIKCLMPYSLFTFHFRQCRNFLQLPRCTQHTEDRGSRKPWTGGKGAGIACAPPQDPFPLGAPLRRHRPHVFSGTWHHQRPGLLCLSQGFLIPVAWARRIADGWRTLVSPGVEFCNHGQALALQWYVPAPGFRFD